MTAIRAMLDAAPDLIPDGVFAPAPDEAFGWPAADVEAEDEIERARRLPPAKRTLRDHVAGVEFIADTIESLDDETISEEARTELSAALIAELAGTRVKVDNVGRALAMFAGLEASAMAERERLDMRVKRYARNGQRLADYVLATLEASKLDRMEGNTSTLARRLNPPSVRIEDVARVPAEFMRTPPAPAAVPDKTAIAIALKAKLEVAGCRLVQGARLVRS